MSNASLLPQTSSCPRRHHLLRGLRPVEGRLQEGAIFPCLGLFLGQRNSHPKHRLHGRRRLVLLVLLGRQSRLGRRGRVHLDPQTDRLCLPVLHPVLRGVDRFHGHHLRVRRRWEVHRRPNFAPLA